MGSPPPHLCKKICVLRFGRLGRRWQQVAIHASGNPPTKVNGKYSVWPILCKQAPNTQPCYIASVCGGLTLLFLEKNPDLFPRPKFGSCKVRTHATEISQLKLMGNVAYVCISKNKPLNPYSVVLYKIVGSPPPHLCKKICVRRFGRLGRRWQQVAIHASGNPPTKVNGKYSFWPILCNPPPNTQLCYIASVCGGLTLLFLEKNPDLFPRPKFGSCKVRTHATEISQLKLMGNVAYVCISKNKPLNPYPVVLYKIVGSPPPHLCKTICVRRFGRLGRRWQQVAIHASGNPPTKVNGKYSFWPILCNPAPNTQPCYIASVCGGLTLLFLEKNPDLFPRPKFCSCKVRTHATEISQLKLMGNVAYVCISKNKPLNPYPVVLYKIVGPPPPHLCKTICVLHFGRLGRRWQQVAIHASGNPPTKVNGKCSFWPILCNPAPNTQPCYIASVCGGLTLLFLEKNPDLFARPKFCSCKVRTHATEISQLKLMGNVAYVCISKIKPLNPYPVALYKIVGSPPPHLCKKICVRRFGRLGRRWHQVAINASGNLPTKVNGKYSFWPILCNPAPNTQPCYIASVCGGLTLLFLEKNPDLFVGPKFGSCKVRTHATEISQLKLMGNVAYVCISKNKPLNPYPVV